MNFRALSRYDLLYSMRCIRHFFPYPRRDKFDISGNKVNLEEVCAGKKVVIFGVPGAFTPGCSKTHLPGRILASSIRSVSDPDPDRIWIQSGQWIRNPDPGGQKSHVL